MKRSTILVLNRFSFINYLRKNRIILILSTFFLLGILLGVLLFNKSEISQELSKSFYDEFLTLRINKKFFYILFNSFLSSFLLIFSLFIIGTSMVGLVLSPFFVCVSGYLYGAFLSFLYSTHSLKGIAFNAIIIIPSAIFILLCLLLSARESLNFSCELIKLTFKRNYASGNIFDFFKNYCGRYIVLLVLLLISSVIDAAFSVLFLDYFKF